MGETVEEDAAARRARLKALRAAADILHLRLQAQQLIIGAVQLLLEFILFCHLLRRHLRFWDILG